MTSELSENITSSFPCDQCDNTFQSSKDWMAHIRAADNHSPICKTCDIEFKNFDNLRHHKRKYHFERSAPAGFVCDTCGKGCKTRELLNDHWNYVHKVEPGLNCNLCGRSCQNMLKLKKHTLMCLSRDPDVVEKERQLYEASLKLGLSRDQDIYEKERQLYEASLKHEMQCQKTENDYDKSNEIPEEERKFHEEDNSENEVKYQKEEDTLNKHVTEEDYLLDVKEENESDVDENDTGVDEMETPSQYIPPMNDATGIFEPPELNQALWNNGDGMDILKRDVIKIETQPDIEPLVCNVKKRKRTKTVAVAKVCPICAKEVKYLNGHIKEVHTETPPENHICNHCGKIFTKIKKLRGHIDAVHKVQPTMCDICSQEFKNLHALRGHKAKVHEVMSEVACPTCSKIFETRLKLYYHERAVHTLEHAKCPVCFKTYKNRNLLQKHIKVYHKELHEAQKAYSGNSKMSIVTNPTPTPTPTQHNLNYNQSWV